jgi:2-polyprenyl-3-methyl-5-hydroxy-6-metoxy-1,4-benzoquinol methylase
MSEEQFDPIAYKKMVKEYQERNDPLGWFDSIYIDANGDHNAVFWADLEPNPYLLQWLESHPLHQEKKKAIVIGCGVGDDAEALAEAGYDVTAFDVAPSAISLCKNRYTQTSVTYVVADLFNYPTAWSEAYDMVYECNTIQVLPAPYRMQAIEAMVSLMAKNAHILVSCRSRNPGEKEEEIPLPLDKEEIQNFVHLGLKEKSFLAYDDTQVPSVPHFFAIYCREI